MERTAVGWDSPCECSMWLARRSFSLSPLVGAQGRGIRCTSTRNALVEDRGDDPMKSSRQISVDRAELGGNKLLLEILDAKHDEVIMTESALRPPKGVPISLCNWVE
jgi:hypothetical protein